MLGMPMYGWSHIKLGDFEGPASYLTDVANDCLEAMIHCFETGFDFIVSFDAEGWTFKVISDFYITYIIEEKNEPVLHTVEMDYISLAKEIVSDIEEYFDEWTRWNYIEEEDDESVLNEERSKLRNNLDTLKKLISEKNKLKGS